MRTLPWLLASALTASGAFAQEATPSAENRAAAQHMFDEARDLMTGGKAAAACPKFAESFRLDPQLGTQLNLAACYEKLGKIASAWINFHDAEIAARRRGEEKRIAVAAEHARQLEPRLSRIAVVVPAEVAAIAGFRIERDGAPVGQGQWGSEVPADPGEHVISAIAPGKRRWEKRIEVKEEAATYKLRVPVLGDADAPPPPEGGAGEGRRIGGYVTLGLGGAGVLVGAILGGVALSKNATSKLSCLPADPNQCTPNGISLRDTAIALGNGSTAALAIGSALAVTGLVLVLTAPSGSSALRTDAPEPAATGPTAWRLSLGPNGTAFSGPAFSGTLSASF